WGADESLRGRNPGCGTPEYASNIKVAFVHHTDGPNNYSAAEVPAIIRGIYAFHVISNGWCDVGYNFLVDRFGRIWEGRYGGISKAVIGAQAGGFNTHSMGAAYIGTYVSVAPSSAAVSAMQHLLTWKLAINHRDPAGLAQLTSGGGPDARYPAGTVVTFPVIAGHRDADQTDCPGQAAYNLLPPIRTAARAELGMAMLNPVISVRGGTDPVSASFSSFLTGPASWTFTVRDSAGTVLRTLTGSGTTSFYGGWDGLDAHGQPLPLGQYTATLAVTGPGGAALPYSMPFGINGSSGDLGIVARVGTGSGQVEVHVLNQKDGYQTYVSHAATVLRVSDPQNWQFALAPYRGDGRRDLYAVHLRQTGSGKVEVHVLAAATGYRSFLLHQATPLVSILPQQWTFRVASLAGDHASDLFAIRSTGAGSGRVEVHVLSASSGYTAYSAHVATALAPPATGEQWSYLIGDRAGSGDLVAIQRTGTPSGLPLVRTVSRASGYQSIGAGVAPPMPAGASTGSSTGLGPATQFSLGDVNGDGVPDLGMTTLTGTASGKVELAAWNGTTGFAQALPGATTVLGNRDPASWDIGLIL
ncbi:MAG TPA: N-acetylmuramoyl-L-alanine amidase, partial [Jatrophihabitans sp.]|nr:N-acetylmuramoyl-L-alanine amidase [Jatrophihabitans sp.]